MSLITDVEKIKTVDEFTEAICLELDDKLMQKELENNTKYVKTQICMYRDSFPNKVSQNSSVNVENNRAVKLPLPPITLESFENNSSDPFAYFTFKKTFLNSFSWYSQVNVFEEHCER